MEVIINAILLESQKSIVEKSNKDNGDKMKLTLLNSASSDYINNSAFAEFLRLQPTESFRMMEVGEEPDDPDAKECHCVFTFLGSYFKITFWYLSHSGIDYSSAYMTKVKPKEKTITYYE